MTKICVVGLGYIGLPTATMFATHHMEVLGVDINPSVVETLRRGEVHIQEPGLKELVQAALRSGNLTIAAQPAPCDAYIIAVPTPFQHEPTPTTTAADYEPGLSKQTLEYKKADMSFVVAAAESILPHLCRDCLVVLESTSPPRTTIDIVRPILERSGLQAGVDFHLAYSPERVLPGQIIHELVHNDRVMGGINPTSAQAARDLYANFVQGEIVLTDATTAEMVKLMENTSRDVNIALAIEFSRLAERLGVDIWEAIPIANRHPRIKILSPGPGVGGHCISVDPWFLVEAAPDLTPLIRTARQVNDAQPRHVLELIRRVLPDLRGKRIAALGLSYKPDVDDLRESPAIEVARLLVEAGAIVKAYEPHKPEASLGVLAPGVQTVPTLEQALGDADLILLLVGHRQFRQLTPAQLATLTPARLVFDAIHAWKDPDWSQAMFTMYRLGAVIGHDE